MGGTYVPPEVSEYVAIDIGLIGPDYDGNEYEFVVEGSMNLDDINDRVELNLESEDYDSLGGYIIEQLDRLPDEKDEIVVENGIRIVVDSLDKNRIEKVHIYLPEDFYDKDENEDEDED